MMTQKHSITLSAVQPRPPKKRKLKAIVPGSAEDVLLSDVKSLLQRHRPGLQGVETAGSPSKRTDRPFSRFTELEIEIQELGSLGDGLGLVDDVDHVVIVPFTLPGDKVVCKLHTISRTHSLADLVKIIRPSKSRDDSLIRCRYFGRCSGCQLQMMPYRDQLDYKRSVIKKAFQRYCPNDTSLPEKVDATHESPKTYGYRTKITPHFDIPRSRGKNGQGESPTDIGFLEKGRRRVLDIEECVIATPALNTGLVEQRAIAKQKHYRRGASILLREAAPVTDEDADRNPSPKRCVTDPNEIMLEEFDKFKFRFPAGSFFQNNNSILAEFTGYVRNQLLTSFDKLGVIDRPRYLVDAYCGSGLFSITCGEGFDSVVGVEISADSVKYASANARANNVTNATFLSGSADKIFEIVKTPPDQTAVIIDPPRKGCDEIFLDQLLDFNPRVIVYVSCNVHTQAKDIDYILRTNDGRFEVTAIRGFDLFPQTHHVESIATLVRN